MLQPGTILLEKYRVERVLGKGGMGVVVAVRHVHLDGMFAIKTMRPEVLESPEALGRFLREARACAKLKGEHVARVHDVGKFPNGTPYMLMEYLEGEDLSRVLEQRGALPVAEAAMYVQQVCDAVAEAHAHGIIHRDLKPSNLFLIRRPNGSPCVKVLDFGISKELGGANKAEGKLTQTGTILGSPMYMSPEQMVDVKTADMRTDIWALGVILYELVTGISPFEADAIPNMVTKVLLSHPEPPSKLLSYIPAEFDAIVMRCLEKQPERRYQSVQELLVDLDVFVSPVSTRVPFRSESSGSIPRSVVIAPRIAMDATMADPVRAAVPNPAGAVAETLTDSAQSAGVMSEVVAATSASTLDKPLVDPAGAPLHESPQQMTLSSADPQADPKVEKVVANFSTANVSREGTNAVVTVNRPPSEAGRNKRLGIAAGIGMIGMLAVGGGFLSSISSTSAPAASNAPLPSATAEAIAASAMVVETKPLVGSDGPNAETPDAAAAAPESAPKETKQAATRSTPKTSPAPKPGPAPAPKPSTTTRTKAPVKGYDD